MEEMTVSGRKIISVLFFSEGMLNSNINTNKFKNAKHPQTVS